MGGEAKTCNSAIADKYGLDLLENGLIEESYSLAENIVTTIRGTLS